MKPKKLLEKLYIQAKDIKERNIKEALVEIGRGKTLLDLGCWDGEETLKWKKAMSAKNVIGIEVVPEAIKLARRKKIKIIKANLDKGKWSIANNSIDCVHSNLLIEHLSNVDHFISETKRVLKNGGYTIVSTNNLSSWHNILSLILGWTPFDLTCSSHLKWAIGNPLAIHTGEDLHFGSTFTHKCVYTTRWLKDWYGLYGFKLYKIYGAGYYPLPSVLGNIDKTHAAFITLVFRK